MTRDQAYIEIAAVEGAAIKLAAATNLETSLADDRALVKHAAITRLVESKQFGSVTAAEKNVEFDPEFLAHRAKERAAVADRIFWQGKYDAAKLRAELAVRLCEPKPDYEIVGEHCPDCNGTGEKDPEQGTLLACERCNGKGVL